MFKAFKEDIDVRKHKDETKVIDAVVYDKAMNITCFADGVIRTAFVIVFVDYEDNAYQLLLFDAPSVYASYEKGNVCEIKVYANPYEYPDTVYSVIDVRHKNRS
jgi:hypothetical protein